MSYGVRNVNRGDVRAVLEHVCVNLRNTIFNYYICNILVVLLRYVCVFGSEIESACSRRSVNKLLVGGVTGYG